MNKSSPNEILCPESFLDWVEENADPSDEQSILAASDKLQALNQNKQFIVSRFVKDLVEFSKTGSPRAMSAQGTVHAERKVKSGSFIVRSVIWTPLKQLSERARVMQDRTLSYTLAHDHNFSLLTAGHFGPGYVTDIYEYDRDKIFGYVGEKVPLRFKESVQLCEDKILFLSALRDVHVQKHPSALSISLNLMAVTPQTTAAMQYEFDVAAGTISGFLEPNMLGRMLATFDLIDQIGCDENLIENLALVAKTHPSEHLRSRAHLSLSNDPRWDMRDSHKISMQDSSPLVRREVGRLMEERG